MKLTHAGSLTVDGEPRNGVFLSGTSHEIRLILERFLIGDHVTVFPESEYENWLSSQEEPNNIPEEYSEQ